MWFDATIRAVTSTGKSRASTRERAGTRVNLILGKRIELRLNDEHEDEVGESELLRVTVSDEQFHRILAEQHLK